MFYFKEHAATGFPGRKISESGRDREENEFAMASETITNGLKQYAIGGKLRRLRLRKSMGLVELGKHTGLSAALLSKVERDVVHPTLPTLLRIAMVFSVGLEYFFNPEPKPVLEIVRKKDRLRFPESADAATPAYWFESLDFPVPNRALDSYYAEFETGEGIHAHEHPGVELLYMIAGRLELTVGGARHELGEGDAVYFEATSPHGYRRLGAKRAAALVVTTDASRGRSRAGQL
jgi:quercetin dioxygenase-like cupin family protein